MASIAAEVFALARGIRYVAVNQNGKIVEMTQNPSMPSLNPTDTDRMEELIVNPVLIELTRRRGELDLSGIRYVVVRYGVLDELVFPYGTGHLSVGVEPDVDVIRVAQEVEKYVNASSRTQPP